MTAAGFSLLVEDADVRWRVARARLHEALSAPFALQVVATIDDDTDELRLAPSALTMKPARATWSLAGGAERAVEGIVERAVAIQRRYELTIVPRLAILADAVDYRVFLDEDVASIVSQVLSEHGIQVTRRALRALPKRTECVQSFESDLAFVARLLAAEGISWRISGKDSIELVDDTSIFGRAGSLPVHDESGLLRGESVRHVRVERWVVPDRTSLRDYDFTKPLVDLTAQSGDGGAEQYEFPGGYRDLAVGKALAAIRLEEARAHRAILRADSNCWALEPGHVWTLEGSGRREVNADWLVLEVEHQWRNDQRSKIAHVAQFTAVPAATRVRPNRTAAPVAPGLQHGTITGPTGAELHTETFGQVRALRRWDRRRPKTHQSSAWIRVGQPGLSGGFLLPRVGWEALLAFASIDAPLVVGRLYNAETPAPFALPAHKATSAFGSLTTPGGGTANVVATDDAARSEALTFLASKDQRERIEKDRVTSIVANETASVGGERSLVVGLVHQLDVAGSQKLDVSADRKLDVGANMTIAAGSESVVIGGSRNFTVAGDYHTGSSSLMRVVGGSKLALAIEHEARSVTGSASVLVGGTWKQAAGADVSINVSGASSEVVGGTKSISCGKYGAEVHGALNETLASLEIFAGGDVVESFGAAASYSIGSAAAFKGGNVVVRASSSLTVKAGGVTLELTPSSINIDGQFDGAAPSVDSGDERYD